MNRILLSIMVIGLAAITGCQEAGKSGVEIVIEGDGQFPAELVGRWIADRGGWEFVFEPDGSISTAVISFGRFTVKPGVVNKYPLREDGEGIIRPGLWSVQYVPETQNLVIEIKIEEFYMQKGDEIVKGKSEDLFVGTVVTGDTTWTAEWISTPEYIVTTKDKTYEEYKLPVDEANVSKGLLTFTKVDTLSQ